MPMKLEDLFDVRNGVASSGLSISSAPEAHRVPYLRPASTQRRTITGWVLETEVGSQNIYPEGTLFVSTNGEGSHSYSYVSRFSFACNSDVSVLLPKRAMTLNEKVYYACCITMNRHRFSYGRKPKGDRLKQIELPDSAPSWVHEVETTDLWSALARVKTLSGGVCNPAPRSEPRELVRVQDIFEVRYGHSLELNRLARLSRESGGIPFVSRKMGDNGIAAYVAPIAGLEPAPAGELSCALSGNALATFYQEQPFYTAFHVACLRPLEPLSVDELLYYCSCIWDNRFRFSYGRQANRTLKDLRIPARESIPSWVNGALTRVADNLIDLAHQPPRSNGAG
jgi:hypothetical protein